MGGILVCLMESKKSWQPRLKNIGKQGSPMDLHNWTFLTIPWTLLPLTRLSTQQAPGSVPLSSNSWEKEPHWMAWVRCSPRIQSAMAWGWCQREQIWLPGLTLLDTWTPQEKSILLALWKLSGSFMVFPIPSDRPALTLTNTFSSFLHLPHCRPYGQLSVCIAQDKLFTLCKPQSPHL